MTFSDAIYRTLEWKRKFESKLTTKAEKLENSQSLHLPLKQKTDFLVELAPMQQKVFITVLALLKHASPTFKQLNLIGKLK